jgi:ankyrin repeat protein
MLADEDPELGAAGDRATAPAGDRATAPAGEHGWWLRLGWWLLGRWLGVALVIAAAWVDVLLVALRLLKRDVLDLPSWFIAQRDPIGLVLQLTVQLPLGIFFALSAPYCVALFFPLAPLLGVWVEMGGTACAYGLTKAIPWVLAALPVWETANAKAHHLCCWHSTGSARRELVMGGAPGRGSGSSTVIVQPGARGGSRLCDCLNVIAGGVLPIDHVALALVRRELGRGADIDAVDAEGQSALHVAARLGLPRTVQALLDAGADPNLQDDAGGTALHAAARAAGGEGGTQNLEGAMFIFLLFFVAALAAARVSVLVLPVLGEPLGMWLVLLAFFQLPLTRCVLDRSARNGARRTAEVLHSAPTADLNTTDNDGNTAMMRDRNRKLPLAPQPAWVEVERALSGVAPPDAGTAATQSALHPVLALLPHPVEDVGQLRLLDMLCGGDEVDNVEQRRRQQLVFDRLIVPLVRSAVRSPLPSAEKKLLIAACEATTHARAQHRDAFDALVGGAMAIFEGELGAAYAALGASTAGQALLDMPVTELLGGIAKADLSQCADLVMGRLTWLEPPSLAGAYQALVSAGALRGIDDMCALLQSGRHRWFAGAHKEHFSDPECWSFWLHVCALNSVARNDQRNAEFQTRVKAIAKTLGAAVHYKVAPVKKYERIVVKAKQYHAAGRLPETAAGAAEAAGRVIDIQRCSLEADDAAMAMKAVALLKGATLAEHGMRPLRCKNGFNAAAESAGGYRDVKLNMLFQAKGVPGAAGRAVVEIQVILKAYLTVKKRMHAVYRLDRGDFDGTTHVLGATLLECTAADDLIGVQRRLGEGADANEKNAALIRASFYGHLAVVEALLAHGDCNMNHKPNQGDTAFTNAGLRENSPPENKAKIRRLLIQNGYEPSFIEHANVGDLAAVQQRLDEGVDIDQKDKAGGTALMEASLHGHGDVVRLLAERGAAMEPENRSGDTALCFAAKGGHVELVRTLLELGATTDGKGAQRAMLQAKDDATKRVLSKHGISLNWNGALITLVRRPWCTALIFVLLATVVTAFMSFLVCKDGKWWFIYQCVNPPFGI